MIDKLIEDIDISIAFLVEDQKRLCDALNDPSTSRPKYIAYIKHWVRLRREIDELMAERATLLEVDEYGESSFAYNGLL